MITKQQIDRINELYRKSKTDSGLSESEKDEQQRLRRLYVDSFKQSLVSNLENTYIIDEHGNKRKVRKKM